MSSRSGRQLPEVEIASEAASRAGSGEYVDRRRAVALLGVKAATLYTYVSRGWLRRVPDPRGRGNLYARADLLRLKARRDARAGHAAVASAALRWGEPVVDSAICTVDKGRLLYRGHDVEQLVARGVSFERVAELLWRGALEEQARWPRRRAPALPRAPGLARHPLRRLQLAAAWYAAHAAPKGFGDELDTARVLIRWLAATHPSRLGTARRTSLAGVTAAALGARSGAEAAIERALIVSADHELNASTFAARVAASAGADLHACLLAALGALSGPLHGGATFLVEELLREGLAARRPRELVRLRLREGRSLPGFGHPLYPDGDPRARLLIEAARSQPRSRPLRVMLAIADAVREAGRAAPNVDFGLVALRAAFALPVGAAAHIFAVGRLAGWIAHAMEQRQQGELIRPRARYVGPAYVGLEEAFKD